ncbi:NAD(+)/NADH kinase [Halapricum hydrolyticum]|uniref:NAD(+)/NADH kinase n=1 Tax=Halapricum hydrolyticum TaxID=2979991 RepID=A0AAE3IBF7_9EURY|nr:NAD(+)/NADH kinase [Halapricum hydrolyticum]MCU4717807.1 NAD(+)/NADH kinase [Halapricum hydrolyticum]MCU4726971.1 NAD(+)/NADH kinase [Halapricum hydrolyticum]
MSDDLAGAVRVHVTGESAEALADAATVADCDAADVVVAVGESALLELARKGCSTPILPVEAGTGVRSVPRERIDAALDSVRNGRASEFELPILGVETDGKLRGRALFDVMLVTEEAAHISEFELETPSDRIAQFRADGFVLATAAGTSGYARRLDAPVFAPETRAAAVVPVAAFATSLDQWVVPVPDHGTVLLAQVAREEAGVTLLVDDRDAGRVPPLTPITIDVVDALRTYRVPESQSCFQPVDGSPREGSPVETS